MRSSGLQFAIVAGVATFIGACTHLSATKPSSGADVGSVKVAELKKRLPAEQSAGDVPSALGFASVEKMDIERLKLEAFKRCQGEFVAPVIIPVPILDPPQVSGPVSEGMIFQEELAVRTTNLLDQDDFYFSPRPRAAVNSLPMEIFVDPEHTGTYQRKSWLDANPDFSSEVIQPPIARDAIPEAGRVLTELVIGHKAPGGGYPQLFDIRSSAYVRFAGYPPQITGASLRLGAHKIFSFGAGDQPTGKEDFPIVRALFASTRDTKTANALLLIENGLFCGAVSLDMKEGVNAELTVDTYLYMRENFYWQNDPHTALLAYSSMLWKTEKQTPEISTDEAHDSDTLRVRFKNAKPLKYVLAPPEKGIGIQDFSKGKTKDMVITGWSLANEDRDPAHYSDFEPALGSSNYDKRASYDVAILNSNVKTGMTLYQQATGEEYGDNIVAATTIRQDIKKATRPSEAVHFKYKTTAYYPN